MEHLNPERRNFEHLEEALNSEPKAVNIRLREGEYQFDLAKAVASFELELAFPDVKDLVNKLFGEKKAEDLQFVSKIQTILKKMEKSGVIKILPKDKPWERQRYALASFKFQDVEKNLIVLAAKPEIDKALNLINTKPKLTSASYPVKYRMTSSILLLVFATVGFYATALWALVQTPINLVIFGSFFCVSVVCSILLGMFISKSAGK